MATTPQAISRVLKNAGFKISKQYRGRICYMNTEGFQVHRDWQKNIVVNYVFRTAGFGRLDDVVAKMKTEKQAVEFLQSRGYIVEQGQFGWNVAKN
jgi:hypothetical protein